jgi:AcrR family transcriptional regulator
VARPRRETPIDLSKEIMAVAQKRLAQHGTAGLSLRAIARDLNITAPAIYNYFRRLEDLITALIVEDFTSLGDALEAALTAWPANDHPGRVKATGVAYRAWAVAHPERYNLIFGTPIPGYTAPSEVTAPAAARSLGVLITALDEALQAGRLPLRAEILTGHPALLAQIESWRHMEKSQAHPYSHYLGLIIASRVQGLVAMELYHQLPPAIDGEAIYQIELEGILHTIGLTDNDNQSGDDHVNNY